MKPMLHHWLANPWAFPLLSLPPLLGLLAVFALRRRNRALARLGNQPALELLVAERGWARVVRGLLAAVELNEPRFAGYQDVLLLSDGDDPAADGGDWRKAAGEARSKGIPVHTVGVGNPDADSTIPTPDGPLLDDDGRKVTTRLK